MFSFVILSIIENWFGFEFNLWGRNGLQSSRGIIVEKLRGRLDKFSLRRSYFDYRFYLFVWILAEIDFKFYYFVLVSLCVLIWFCFQSRTLFVSL
jgi:hypothetical protein